MTDSAPWVFPDCSREAETLRACTKRLIILHYQHVDLSSTNSKSACKEVSNQKTVAGVPPTHQARTLKAPIDSSAGAYNSIAVRGKVTKGGLLSRAPCYGALATRPITSAVASYTPFYNLYFR